VSVAKLATPREVSQGVVTSILMLVFGGSSLPLQEKKTPAKPAKSVICLKMFFIISLQRYEFLFN
jgi:hypothetical protein